MTGARIVGDELGKESLKIQNGTHRTFIHVTKVGPDWVFYLFQPNLTINGPFRPTNIIDVSTKNEFWYVDLTYPVIGEYLLVFGYNDPKKGFILEGFFTINVVETLEFQPGKEPIDGLSFGVTDEKPVIYSVSTLIKNTPPDLVLFLKNRFKPSIIIFFAPSQNVFRNVSITIDVKLDDKTASMEENIFIYRDSVNVTFKPMLKTSNGLLDFKTHFYFLNVTTVDEEDYKTESQYLIQAPQNHAILRSLIILIIGIWLILELIDYVLFGD